MLVRDAGGLVVNKSGVRNPSRLDPLRKILCHRVVQAARWPQAAEEVCKSVYRRGGLTHRGGQITILDNQDAAGPENRQHLLNAGCGIREMEQQEPAVHEIEGGAWQTGLTRIRLNEG